MSTVYIHTDDLCNNNDAVTYVTGKHAYCGLIHQILNIIALILSPSIFGWHPLDSDNKELTDSFCFWWGVNVFIKDGHTHVHVFKTVFDLNDFIGEVWVWLWAHFSYFSKFLVSTLDWITAVYQCWQWAHSYHGCITVSTAVSFQRYATSRSYSHWDPAVLWCLWWINSKLPSSVQYELVSDILCTWDELHYLMKSPVNSCVSVFWTQSQQTIDMQGQFISNGIHRLSVIKYKDAF